HLVSTALCIHPVSPLIHTQPEATAHFLPLSGLVVGMFEGADLEHVGVIPAFPQSGMGEDKPGRLFKRQETFLIFQNQIIGRNIIRKLTAAFDLTVYAMPGLFVDTEITFVCFGRSCTHFSQVLLIW